jgi:c(7)-type cytochrome triheme protein
MMKKGYAKMKMVEIIKGKHCGRCHDGEKAFASNKAEFCARCHKKM